MHPLEDLAARPERGRTFSHRTRIRLADVTPKSRLRLDGMARLLQDVATDDALDGAPDEDAAWVVRRTRFDVLKSPRYTEDVELTTWCSGYGSRWAQRRTSVEGDEGGHVEAVSLWIHIDRSTQVPTKLTPTFFSVWAEASVDDRIRARRRLPESPEPSGEPWAFRFADFDALAHVNNAAYWESVEEALGAETDIRPPFRAEIEYRDGIVRGDAADVVSRREGDTLDVWLVREGRTLSSARISAL